MKFLDYAKDHRIITDGAMGTYYGEKYKKAGRNPELSNLTHPERILEIHKEYLRAGAGFLRTNSFSSNLQTLSNGNIEECKDRTALLQDLSENVKASFLTAEQAVKETGFPAFIAGDIGPIPEQGTWEEDEIAEEYRTIVDALLEAGAEILLFETFSDFQRILPAAAYAKQKKDVCILASFCLNKFGYTRSGLSASGILSAASETPCLDGIGFNCGIGPAHMYAILKKLDFGDLLVSAVPNSGYPDLINDRSRYQENAAYFCEQMKEIAALGINLAGGCCGTTPAHIAGISREIPKAVEKRSKRNGSTRSDGSLRKEQNAFYRKLKAGKGAIVAELDPPHDGSRDKVLGASLLLKQAGADLVTFSDSPMGKMRADSMMTGAMIQRETGAAVMPHVTCRDKNRLGMGSALLGAHMNGIRNLLLITGDPVLQGDRSQITPVFDFYSVKLMEYVRQLNLEYFPEDPIIYGGALNHGRANLEKEIQRTKKKCEAGADFFLTQPVFGEEDIARIEAVKKQVHTRILCGIMPLVSYRNAMFMKNEVFGINVPEEITARYHKDMSRAEGEECGIHTALETVEKLQGIGDGYYFMAPFNRASMICEIMKRMKEKCLI